MGSTAYIWMLRASTERETGLTTTVFPAATVEAAQRVAVARAGRFESGEWEDYGVRSVGTAEPTHYTRQIGDGSWQHIIRTELYTEESS